MFKIMVARWHTSRPYLGVGAYYRKPDDAADARHDEWVSVNLSRPLLLDNRQVRMLIQKYSTNSSDDMKALAGAWTLRRELLQTGHDGIVAIEAAPNERHMIVVDLTRSPDSPRGHANHEKVHGDSSNVIEIATLR
jgi:hypothetical protein